MNNQSTSPVSFLLKHWRRLPVAIRAIIIGFLVFAVVGSLAWTAVVILLPAPWSLVIMIAVLWLYIKYFSGSWGPISTVETRRINFRATKLSWKVWKWSIAAALLAVVVFQSFLVVTFRIIEFNPDAWTIGFDFTDVPLWMVWFFIVMAAAVAGITEEVGFRGYMQVPLEKHYSPASGIVISSVVFMLFHLNQAWAGQTLILLFGISILWGVIAYTSGSLIPGIISHAVTDILNFSYWWTDVAGTFSKRPIAETGIESHFIIWVTILVSSFALFVWTARKTLDSRQKNYTKS